MNGGTGQMSARMHMGEHGKIIPCKIHPSGSIGTHSHATSDDINYVISGTGVAICDGQEEPLAPGVCHVCLKGSEHTIMNTGDEYLCLLTVVVEREKVSFAVLRRFKPMGYFACTPSVFFSCLRTAVKTSEEQAEAKVRISRTLNAGTGRPAGGDS